MTTPVNSIPIANNVQPNDDIQDPIVQEILGNMAESASQQPIQQPIQHGHTYLQLLQHLMALQSVDSPKP